MFLDLDDTWMAMIAIAGICLVATLGAVFCFLVLILIIQKIAASCGYTFCGGDFNACMEYNFGSYDDDDDDDDDDAEDQSIQQPPPYWIATSNCEPTDENYARRVTLKSGTNSSRSSATSRTTQVGVISQPPAPSHTLPDSTLESSHEPPPPPSYRQAVAMQSLHAQNLSSAFY